MARQHKEPHPSVRLPDYKPRVEPPGPDVTLGDMKHAYPGIPVKELRAARSKAPQKPKRSKGKAKPKRKTAAKPRRK